MTKKNYKDELIKYPVFLIASCAAKFTGAKIYVVGGFVRDLVLGIENDDIDFLCVGDGIKVAQEFSRLTHGELTVYENFGTAMVKYGDQKVEFVGARKEVYERGSRKPFVFDGTLEDDIMRRDFTINAMCIDINDGGFGDLIDLVGGLDDLDDGIIRCVGDPVERFSEDPLRMLRCIRFKCKLSVVGNHFQISTKTIEGIKKCKDEIKTLSGERITEELNKIMSSQDPSDGIRWLEATGLLEHILPEVHALRMPGDKGHKDIFEHTLQVLDNVAAKSDDLYLRWAALLHDIGKVPTKKYDEKRGWTFESHAAAGAKMVEKIFRRLHLPLDSRMEYVRKLVDMHMRPTTLAEEGVTDSAIRRLIFDAGDALDALLILAKSDVTTRYEERRNKIYNNLVIIEKHIQEVEEKDALRNWKNPIDGNYIMETFGIGPCKTVAVLKDAVKEAILDGVIGNNFDEAEVFVKKKAKEIGLV
jgi:putative nucleotidyltransferase with HDIG domain